MTKILLTHIRLTSEQEIGHKSFTAQTWACWKAN